MGRAPKSTGASDAAVTSAIATETNLSENCIVAYNPDVAGKKTMTSSTERSIPTEQPFYTWTEAQQDFFFLFSNMTSSRPA